MSSKIEGLGTTIDRRIRTVNKSNSKPVSGLGNIGKKLSLLVDGSSDPIPQGEYSVCKNVSGKLQNGDRVLIVWCGKEPTVVDVVE